jgi:small subunit ribosomal protein S16
MLKIRLQRVGRKNDPHFRLVVLDSKEGPRSGNIIETLGFKNPKTKELKVDAERAKFYIGNGAQTSDTVHNILVSEGIVEGKKKNPLPKKSPIVKEASEAEEPKAVEETQSESEGEAKPEDMLKESPEEDAPVDEVAEEKAEDTKPEEETAPEEVAEENKE